jgi:hypothetical protein
MITGILDVWKSLARQLTQYLKQWTRPKAVVLAAETLSDMSRSRADLIAENALLRQQIIVLKRQVKRPQLTQPDRVRQVLSARCTQFWRQALHILQPETLLRWHRGLFRGYWRRKSRNKKRKPRISPKNRSDPIWGPVYDGAARFSALNAVWSFARRLRIYPHSDEPLPKMRYVSILPTATAPSDV